MYKYNTRVLSGLTALALVSLIAGSGAAIAAPATARVEPGAGNWPTWLLSSGSELRLPAPVADQAELDKHGIRGAPISVKPNANELAEITKLIEEKKIKPIVSLVLPLSEAVKAQEQAATHHTRGKIVLKIADEPK